jgi:hypothetical protein
MVTGTWLIVVQLQGIFYSLLARHLATLLLDFVLLPRIELLLITHRVLTVVAGITIFLFETNYSHAAYV